MLDVSILCNENENIPIKMIKKKLDANLQPRPPVEHKHRLLFQAHDDLTHLHSLWMISPTFSSCTNMKSNLLYLSHFLKISANFTTVKVFHIDWHNIALEIEESNILIPSSSFILKIIFSRFFLVLVAGSVASESGSIIIWPLLFFAMFTKYRSGPAINLCPTMLILLLSH